MSYRATISWMRVEVPVVEVKPHECRQLLSQITGISTFQVPEVAVFFMGSQALTYSMLQLSALISNFLSSFFLMLKLEGFLKESLGSNRKNGGYYSSTANTVAAYQFNFREIDKQTMPSSRSRSPLLLYGIVLCSFFAPFQVVSSNGQTIQNKGTVAPGNRTCCSKREATNTDEEYLLGIKRQRRLYCNIGIGFHIQVLPTGKITGVHHENRYSEYLQPQLISQLQFQTRQKKFANQVLARNA